MISIIVAVDLHNAIGKRGAEKLLWHLPADLRHFKELTVGTTIIMGRNTYESIGKPLPHRTSIVITRQPHYQAPGCTVVHSLEEAFEKAHYNAFVIGGAEIYQQALPFCERIYLTRLHHVFHGDIFFPTLDSSWKEVSHQDGVLDEKNIFPHTFFVYEKK